MNKDAYVKTPWEYIGDGFDSVAATHVGTEGYQIGQRIDDNFYDIAEITFCDDDEGAEEYAKTICRSVNLHNELIELLKEIANSDMAMREEDEGNVSSLLDKVRALIKRDEALV